MLSATKHLFKNSNITQTLMNTRNVSSLMKNVSFLVKIIFSLFRLSPVTLNHRYLTRINR